MARSTHRISELVGAVKAYSFMDRAVEQEVDVHEGIENTLVILAHKLRNITVRRGVRPGACRRCGRSGAG